jgi:glycosyltransferase involved in cell wall biosynthesis
MIAIKGVAQLVAAQQQLQRDGVDLRLILAGPADPANPTSFDEATLTGWSHLKGITWTGYREDVRTIWTEAQIAVLASLGGEGLPKTLLEAAACGRAIVATDIPGTRDIARDGISAILVPPGDVDALAAALKRLTQDSALRQLYAAAGRQLTESHYSDPVIMAETESLYRALTAAVLTA